YADQTGGDPRPMADFDISQNLGTRPDHHALTDFRMAVAGFFAGAAERHVVQHGNIVIDDGRFADDKPARVIEEDTAADLCGRMNIALKHRRRTALQIERKIAAPPGPEPVRQTVGLNGVEAFVVD